jgi:hypothetical protein
MKEENMNKGILLGAFTALILMSGCSFKDNELAKHNERSREFLKESENYTIADRITERRNVIDYVWVYPNERLSLALKDLGKLQGKYYFLQGRDFEIKGTQAFKAHDFNELNDYVKTLTNYEIEITKNLLHATLPKIVEVKEQKRATILDEIKFDSKLYNVPAQQFSELTKITDGWRVVDDADIKAEFNAKQYVNFKGSMREFLEYYGKNNNIFVDLDYINKEIVFKKYKTKHFPLSITTDKYVFNNEIQTSLEDENANSGSSKSSTSKSDNKGEQTGKMSVSSTYDIVSTLKGLMGKIIPEKSTDEYWTFFDATNELVVKTSPDKMETVESVVNSVNQNALKQVYMKVSVFEVTLSKEFQYGIDWGYLNKVADSSGNLIKVAVGNSSGTAASIDTTLTQPSVYKLAGEGLNLGVTDLNVFGEARVVNQAPLLTTNNIPAFAILSDRHTYISDFTSTTTASVGSDNSIEQSKAIGGSYIYLRPTVFQDKISIDIRIIRAAINDILKQTFPDGKFVQSPDDTRTVLNQKITINSGEKFVVGGLIQREEKRNFSGLHPDGNSVLAPLTGVKSQDYRNKEVVLVIEAKEI